MPRTGRSKAESVLTEDEREQLTRWTRRGEIGADAGVALEDRAGLREWFDE